MKIAFIGGGNMARALIGGLHTEVVRRAIHVVDRDESVLALLQRDFTCETSTSIDAQICSSDVIVLAIKPDGVAQVCEALCGSLTTQLIVSVAAGVDVASLRRWLGGYERIVRAMPNLPALVRCGVTGLYASTNVDSHARHLASQLFDAVGDVLWLDKESLIDAITGVSGSGPAYVFYFVEALVDAARELGLDETMARRAAYGTVGGAVALLNGTGESATVLRERVTSKGGTTAAALSELETRGVRSAIIAAARQATARAIEMRCTRSQMRENRSGE